MIFYSKNTDLNEGHRKKPSKLKYIVIWLTLIIIVNVIFYYLGLFETSVNPPIINKIPKKVKVPKIISKNNTFRNDINYKRIDKNVFDIVPKENIEAIDSILNEVKNIPVPKTIQIDEYNFE